VSVSHIHIKGAREHNLKNLELKIPRNQLVVITGVSGSGKSSLAFDTLYAEGYRKYMDSLSTRARQLLESIKHPELDFVHGLSPVIAIEQRGSKASNPRNTVASVSEIADYARLLWAIKGTAYCPKDGGLIEKRSLDDCLDHLFKTAQGQRLILLAPYLTASAALIREELPRLLQQGFQRVRIDGKLYELAEKIPNFRKKQIQLDLVIDRLIVKESERSRLADSLELAFREGKDRAIALIQKDKDSPFKEIPLTQNLACNKCGTPYEPLTSRHFSYNHPEGACENCSGVGETLQFLPELVIPDPSLSVKAGAVKAWRMGSKNMIIRRNALLRQLAEQLPFDINTPWEELPKKTRDALLYGTGDRLFKLRVSRYRAEMRPFPGILTDLATIFPKLSSELLKARLMAFQTSSVCTTCQGKRLNAQSQAVLLNKMSLSDFMHLPLDEAHAFTAKLVKQKQYADVSDATAGLHQRIHFLNEVGLSYLTCDRQYATLSGGEAQRVRLASQLGMGLVGVLYVLDEPSIGLHPHDHGKLVKSLIKLRERGNSVVIVEHDEATMNEADYLIELGPGAGHKGGEITFEGTPKQCKRSKTSLTGAYLSKERCVEKNAKTLSATQRTFTIRGASEHNLRNLDVEFPVGLLTCVCGVSGSGKSTLINDILAKAAAFKLNRAKTIPGKHKKIEGLDHFDKVIRVDQEPIGRTPRSNPATFVKLFDPLRTLFSKCPLSKVRGYKPGRFSFNMRGGRCERCQGDGVIALDMLFLGDVYSECPSCNGKRYNRETLEVRFKGHNIADVLEMTVDEAAEIFNNQPAIFEKLKTLQAVGLGYLKLGQSSTTLSGGEAQRIKLSLELSKRSSGKTLYLLDEPTTGLHWEDIQKLLDLLFRLRDAGNTLIIIEHHTDVIRLADHLIELGPGGGKEGGQLVYNGPAKKIKNCKKSLTGKSLQ